MRIVVDTNVLISALVFGGPPGQVLEPAESGLCSLHFSPSIEAEVESILEAKFGGGTKHIQAATQRLWSFGTRIYPRVPLAVITDDPDDDRILECAVAAEADAIVSGDRHLLRLGSFQSIPIKSSRQFLDSRAWEMAP
jgi:putative PIN family toxin of toxin-antitoxin system